MKKFKMIEKKDPYENISPNNLIVRRYDGIKTLITYSRYSFVFTLILCCIFKSPLYNILEQGGTAGMIAIGGFVIILAVALPGTFIGLFLWLLGFVKFIYNLINKKIIGVDLYSDIVDFLDHLAYRIEETSKEDYECDNNYYYDYTEDDFSKDNNENDNLENKGKIITVDFNEREPI